MNKIILIIMCNNISNINDININDSNINSNVCNNILMILM